MKIIVKCLLIILIPIILVPFIYYYFIHPNTYPLKKAIANTDVILAADGLHNSELIDKFIEKTKDKVDAQVRVVVYSKEGYPNIFDITYSNGYFECRNDNTRNRYGRSFFITKGVYERIEVDKNRNYFLKNINGESLWFFQANN